MRPYGESQFLRGPIARIGMKLRTANDISLVRIRHRPNDIAQLVAHALDADEHMGSNLFRRFWLGRAHAPSASNLDQGLFG